MPGELLAQPAGRASRASASSRAWKVPHHLQKLVLGEDPDPGRMPASRPARTPSPRARRACLRPSPLSREHVDGQVAGSASDARLGRGSRAEVEDQPGVLADLTRRIASAGIDLDLVYVATRNRIVFRAPDLAGLRAALADPAGPEKTPGPADRWARADLVEGDGSNVSIAARRSRAMCASVSPTPVVPRKALSWCPF
jgi:hypothetical protein